MLDRCDSNRNEMPVQEMIPLVEMIVRFWL